MATTPQREPSPATKEVVYLNCAAQMPPAAPMRGAMEDMLSLKERPQTPGSGEYFSAPIRDKERIARPIIAFQEEIGSVTFTSAGLSGISLDQMEAHFDA